MDAGDATDPVRRFPRALRLALWSTPLLLLLAAYAGVALLSAERLTRAHQLATPVDPLVVSERAEPWSVHAEDGVTLRGWYHPNGTRGQLVVLIHGLWAGWYKHADLAHDLHARGYDVLLFDLRGHGESEPTRVSMGRREKQDVRAVLKWARGRGFAPDAVGWVGFSMGASTILMEAARNPDIRVAVLDSPYGDLPELLDSQLTRHSGLPRWFNPGILTAAHLVYGVRTDDLVPIRSARSWGNRPLLLIHGEDDDTVPVAQARQLAAAAGPACRALWLPGVNHTEAYDEDPAGYVAAVDGFLTQHLRR